MEGSSQYLRGIEERLLLPSPYMNYGTQQTSDEDKVVMEATMDAIQSLEGLIKMSPPIECSSRFMSKFKDASDDTFNNFTKSIGLLDRFGQPRKGHARFRIATPINYPAVSPTNELVQMHNRTADQILEVDPTNQYYSLGAAPCDLRRSSPKMRVVKVPAVSGKLSEIPNDDFQWRKYGQKTIKGYLRGYYRCSGFKNCPARKQVDRDPTDDTMLIISYAGHHDHRPS